MLVLVFSSNNETIESFHVENILIFYFCKIKVNRILHKICVCFVLVYISKLGKGWCPLIYTNVRFHEDLEVYIFALF